MERRGLERKDHKRIQRKKRMQKKKEIARLKTGMIVNGVMQKADAPIRQPKKGTGVMRRRIKDGKHRKATRTGFK